MKNNFTEEDKKKVIAFLNFLSTKSTLNPMSFQESIDWFKLLSFMQQTLIPKIDANILEVLRVVESKQEPEQKSE